MFNAILNEVLALGDKLTYVLYGETHLSLTLKGFNPDQLYLIVGVGAILLVLLIIAVFLELVCGLIANKR